MRVPLVIAACAVGALIICAAVFKQPITVQLPYVTTWHVPIGPAFDAPPPARPADWKNP